MRISRIIRSILLACLPVPPQALAQFQPALPGYHYAFPRDFFAHPGYQTEWWYYTGNLQTAEGHKFGFELTFFRQGVTREPGVASSWALRDIYVAHFAVSDLEQKQFLHAERTNRAGPGLAGASESSREVWNGNWKVVWSEGGEQLTAVAGSFAISLSLQPQKPPVIHGEHGVSQKSAGAGRASHYFSETRLAAVGSLSLRSRQHAVAGLAWMDHEFFTHQLESDQAGWDWISLQLNDHTELMLFHLRKKDGTIDRFSAGTFVDAQGRATHLRAEDFFLEPAGETWMSPASHASYPVHWKIRVPDLGLVLDVMTPLPSQEITEDSRTLPSYWEGAVFLRGTRRSTPIAGSGYLEMTGYDRPVAFEP